MSAALQPVTRQRLDQFRRRRRALESLRGLAVALLLGLACLLVVVIIDASVVVPQAARWLLSLCIYGVLVSCALATAWRAFGNQQYQWTARQFEHLEPRLREHLLAAVELSQDTPANLRSSLSFRERLQRQVAEMIAPVRIGKLLPWTKVAGGLAAALLSLGIVVALAWVPGLHWPHRVARALLPAANLGRISRFDVQILAPQPASTVLPGGAVVAIEARVRGPLPSQVTLETRTAGISDSQSMRGITRTPALGQSVDTNAPASAASAVQIAPEDLVYTANVTMADEAIEYRVLADDAHTAWHRLESRPRPAVEAFQIRIVHPAYSQLPDRSLESDVGDIRALRGSRVKLEITCNQPIAQGWLELSMPESPEPRKIALVPLTADEDQTDDKSAALAQRRFRAELIVDSDYSYRIHLESSETKFTNAFSTEYQVRALVDDAPRVAWIRPEGSMVVVEPNQLVSLSLKVDDELPLAEALLITSLNGQEPVGVPFDLSKASVVDGTADRAAGDSSLFSNTAARTIESTISSEFDLLQLKPKLGDTMRVIVQATDRAGQSTLSTPIELIVSSTAVDPQRRPATEQRLELAGDLRKFAEQVQPQVKRLRELNDALNKMPAEDGERTARLDEFQKAAVQLSAQAENGARQLREKVVEHLKQPQDSVSLAELERTGQVLARLQSQLSHELSRDAKLVDPSSNSSYEAVSKAMQQTRAAADRVGDAVGVLDRRFREFVAHDVLSEVARGLSVVQDFQSQLVATADQESPAQLKRRQAVAARQLRELEQIMVDRSPLLREQAAHGLRGWIEWAGQLAERIERATADPDDNPSFQQFSKQVYSEIKQRQNVMSVDGGLESEINNGRRELDARSESAAAVLQEQVRITEKSTQSSGGLLTDEARRQFDRGLELLQERKELQQARGDADSHHVSDLGNAIRATRSLNTSEQPMNSASVKQLQKTAAALRKLEAIHNVTEASKHLADLEQIERWHASSIDARTESPRAWDAFRQRTEQAARALREAGIEAKLADRVDRIRNSTEANEAAQKIQARRWTSEVQASAALELDQLRSAMDAARADLDAIARAARLDLMEMAPSVPELARKAAEQTNQLQQATEQLAQSAAAEEVPDLKSRMDQLAQEKKQTEAPINDLRDALTEMAAVQDLLDDNQRAIARDADTSGQIIEKAGEQIQQSLEEAASATSASQAAEPLDKAADVQQQAATALQQIADHFAKLQAGNLAESELADSRKALRQMANDMDMSAMDEWYKAAETLSQLAGGDPQQILKKLEEELNRNLRMREELSDISRQAVEESVKSLAFSADQERNLQSQLEQSDPAYAARKQLLQQDIQAANERMHQWMQQLSSDANAVTSRAGARPEQQRLAELQEQLQQTIADASAAHSSMPLEDLQRVAEAIVKSLAVAESEFGSVAEKLQPKSDEPVHASDQELRNRKREMEDWERRMLQQQARGAQSVERSHEQRSRQADNAVRNAESLKRNAERMRDDVDKQAKAKPESADLKQRLQDAEKAVRNTDREVKLAQQREAALKERLAGARQTQQEMTARKPTELASRNPTAELATRIARNAASTSQRIASDLKKGLEDAGWVDQLAAAGGQLRWSAQQQSRVEDSVDGVAGNLNRAARHEQRLEHPRAAERIANQATQVAQAKEEEVHTAQTQLASAADAARQQAESAADPIQANDAAPAAASRAAIDAVSQAESELRIRANDLKQLLDQPQEEEAATTKDPSAEAAGQPSVPLDPKMMARMLDELDRQMSQAESDQQQDAGQAQSSQPGEAGKSEDENNQNSSQQSSPTGNKKQSSQTSSMQQASRQLAEQMNRQRAQSRQSTASSRMTGNTADTKAAPPSSVRVLNVDRRSDEDWGKLREQAAEQTLESTRQSVAPQYRNSVETYFRVLSQRGHK